MDTKKAAFEAGGNDNANIDVNHYSTAEANCKTPPETFILQHLEELYQRYNKPFTYIVSKSGDDVKTTSVNISTEERRTSIADTIINYNNRKFTVFISTNLTDSPLDFTTYDITTDNSIVIIAGTYDYTKADAPLCTDCTVEVPADSETQSARAVEVPADVEEKFGDGDDEFVQHLENLPAEIQDPPRYFPVLPNKHPKLNDWSNPQKQKHWEEIDGLAGFDCAGHDVSNDYCFLDFDHIFDAEGNFVNEQCKELVNFVLTSLPNCYCEKSKSGGGLHILINPTKAKFLSLIDDKFGGKLSGGKKGTIYLPVGQNNIKLEIFYLTKARYCLFTGNRWQCDEGATIPNGDVADNCLQALLDRILKENFVSNDDEPTFNFTAEKSARRQVEGDSPEYERDRILAMLSVIDPSKLDDSDWLAVVSACKNLGVSYSDIDSWCRQDTNTNAKGEKRYNEKMNLNRYKTLNDSSFGIETLHGIAKRFGYSERDFKRQWYDQHPEYNHSRPAKDNSTDNDDSKFDNELFDKLLFSDDLGLGDVRNARRIVALSGDRIRYIIDDDKFITYDSKTGIWQCKGKGNAILYPDALKMSDSLNDYWRKFQRQGKHKNFGKKQIDATNKDLATLFKTHTLDKAIQIMKGIEEIHIQQSDLDNHPELFCVLNGVVELTSSRLFPFTPALLLTQKSRAEYRAGYHNEIVEKFLKSIIRDEETLAAVLSYGGYTLSGENRGEKFMFWYGKGGNGKTTLTNTLMYLLGDYATSFPVAGILQSGKNNANEATPIISALVGKRLAVSDEIPPNRKLDVAQIKRLSGGDKLYYRPLYSEAKVIENPCHKLIFSGNSLPEITDVRDPGLQRRLLTVEFKENFIGKDCDPFLKKKLVSADALAGLLTLLVEAAKQWYKDGLLISADMQQTTEKYLDSMDWINEFICEHCEFGENLSIPLKNFIEKLRAARLESSDFKTDASLRNAIKKLDYIKFEPGTHNLTYIKGIGWRDGVKQGTLS